VCVFVCVCVNLAFCAAVPGHLAFLSLIRPLIKGQLEVLTCIQHQCSVSDVHYIHCIFTACAAEMKHLLFHRQGTRNGNFLSVLFGVLLIPPLKQNAF